MRPRDLDADLLARPRAGRPLDDAEGARTELQRGHGDVLDPAYKKEAKQILETTDFNVETIGEEVGYEDPASFRRLFKRKSGLTPAEYRRLFGRRRFERYHLNN